MTSGCIARWLLTSCSMIVLAIGLGACSSSFDGLTTQAAFGADNDGMCQVGSGPATGMAALNGAQTAYAQCMQQRFAAGSMGFRPEDSFAPGRPASLAAIGQQ